MNDFKIEPYVETRSGKRVTFLDPKPDDIDIRDIAYSLANQCRFNGHCSAFYSVAEHSVHVSSLLPRELQLGGLLHDAAEAFVGDIPSPIKQFVPNLRDIEDSIVRVIFEKFGCLDALERYNEIKQVDLQQLYTEAHYLLPSGGKHWNMWNGPRAWSEKDGVKPVCALPQYAFRAFMISFEELTNTGSESKLILPKAA